MSRFWRGVDIAVAVGLTTVGIGWMTRGEMVRGGVDLLGGLGFALLAICRRKR